MSLLRQTPTETPTGTHRDTHRDTHRTETPTQIFAGRTVTALANC